MILYLAIILFLLILTLPIYFLFFYEANPSYSPPKNVPLIRKSLNPLSLKVRSKKNPEFQQFLNEEGTTRLDVPFSVKVTSRARYTSFSDKFFETPQKATVSSLSSNVALNLPFPHQFACTELYISKKRQFLGFYSTFDQKIFAVRLNEIVRVSNFFPETNRIWVECWIHKSLIRFEIESQKASDLFFQTLTNQTTSGLNQLLEVPKRRVLIVHNPTSGTGKSAPIFADAKALYSYVGLKYDAVCTKHRGHAREHMLSKLRDPHTQEIKYDAVLAIGGDGTLTEILNGLRDDSRELLNQLPVVPIPAGSGNGVSQALFGCGDDHMVPLRAVLHNHRSPMDTMLMRLDEPIGQANGPAGPTEMVAALSLTVGIVADADLESEFLRFLGDLRFVLYSVYLTLRHFRTYPMKLTMSVDENFQPGTDYINIAPGQTHVTLSDNYYSFLLGNVPYITKDIIAFNYAVPNDGYIDVLLVPKTYNLIRLVLIFIAMLGGYVSTQPSVQYFKTKHVVVEPDIERCPSQNMMLDGEPEKLRRVECLIENHGSMTLSVKEAC
mmetsp:Transcript_4265/g.16077  ORF Transcript_4265/g.16077 Transcript_4265/m.16077 type:complete len:552 (-) Transcript_4265:288-1943(-)